MENKDINPILNSEFWSSILEELPLGVAVIDTSGRMIYYNKIGEEISNLNTPNTPADDWAERYGIFHENGEPYSAEQLPILMALKGQDVVDRVMLIKKGRTDSNVVISVSARPIRNSSGEIIAAIATFRDRTEETKVRNALEQARRLEAIGRLAGGVAHDFNNMLGTVMMAANHCLKILPPDDECRGELQLILEVSERSSLLTRKLLAVGRKQVMQPRVFDMAKALRNYTKIISRLIGENIKLKFIDNTVAPTASIDPVQFEQVILNLCINARDAMPNGGRITIETDVVQVDAKYVKSHPAMKSGKYAVVMVSDNGSGIAKDDLDKIFDPFFSSKVNGFGLGLSTVEGIVEQSGGFIWPYSEVGQGTTFKVYFPYVEVNEEDEQPSVQSDTSDLTGTETILLVEDDIPLQTSIGKCLREHGYTVLIASNGMEAQALKKNYAAPIHLLLTDVVMPGMNGRELSLNLKAMDSNLEVIFTSGYSENVVVTHGILNSGVHFLQKPVSETELLQKIRKALAK
jgi:signal transduction histidine kinase/ActR/RegA family two-component response regulator